jgi:predicted lipid-binding transport protein (Tim44 family)
MHADIIILAAIAIFILLRLRSVLGHKIGHDQPPQPPQDLTGDKNERVVQLQPKQQSDSPAMDETTLREAEAQQHQQSLPEHLQDGVKEFLKYDKSFRMDEFIEGASAAFEMVIKAYSENDQSTLQSLLSRDLYSSFKENIESQRADGRYVETTLVSIERAEPQKVQLEKKHHGRITVLFETEQIQVVRDENNEIIEGDPSQIDVVTDEWVFERDLRSANPNWKIIST